MHISTIHSLLLFRPLRSPCSVSLITRPPVPGRPRLPSIGRNPPATRTFEVIPGSHHVLEASNRKLENVKAVLVVNAICTAVPEPNFYAQVENAGKEIGPMFAQHDGLIVKHFLCSAWGDKDIGGGLYFFETKEQAEAYLASEFWDAILVDTEWDKDSITYELYSVNGYAMAA